MDDEYILRAMTIRACRPGFNRLEAWPACLVTTYKETHCTLHCNNNFINIFRQKVLRRRNHVAIYGTITLSLHDGRLDGLAGFTVECLQAGSGTALCLAIYLTFQLTRTDSGLEDGAPGEILP
jgi:hypothetical protein